jgi:hypothetical protein
VIFLLELARLTLVTSLSTVRLLGWGPEIAALELVFSYEDPLFVFPCAACFRSAFAGSGMEGKDPKLLRLAAA